MKKEVELVYTLIIIFLVVACFGAGIVVANETGMTFVGEDELEAYSLVAPAKRVDTVYGQGSDKVFIKYSNTKLVPVGEGDSMLPMVTEEHLVLITTNTSDIQVGDFIVVDGLADRYFHQVVKIEEGVFTTRGINRTENDMFPVFGEDIVGIAIAVFW